MFASFALGIGGEKCDECAVGFVQDAVLTEDHPVLTRQIAHGDLPQCVECGECFTNWNRILMELKNITALKVISKPLILLSIPSNKIRTGC